MSYNRSGAIQALHATARQKGWDHEELKSICSSLTNIPLSKLTLAFNAPPGSGRVALTNSQLSAILANIKGTAAGAPIQVHNAATVRQLWKIKNLAFALRMIDSEKISHAAPPERLAGFIFRQVKKNDLTDLTPKDAQKVIDGLKQLVQRGTTTSANEQPHP